MATGKEREYFFPKSNCWSLSLNMDFRSPMLKMKVENVQKCMDNHILSVWLSDILWKENLCKVLVQYWCNVILTADWKLVWVFFIILHSWADHTGAINILNMLESYFCPINHVLHNCWKDLVRSLYLSSRSIIFTGKLAELCQWMCKDEWPGNHGKKSNVASIFVPLSMLCLSVRKMKQWKQ